VWSIKNEFRIKEINYRRLKFTIYSELLDINILFEFPSPSYFSRLYI